MCKEANGSPGDQQSPYQFLKHLPETQAQTGLFDRPCFCCTGPECEAEHGELQPHGPTIPQAGCDEGHWSFFLLNLGIILQFQPYYARPLKSFFFPWLLRQIQV